MPPPLILLVLLLLPRAANGEWGLLHPNIGVSAMHMQLLFTDRVLIFDRTDFGASNISLPAGRCRRDPNDTALPVDCTAHSVEYHPASNSVRPLTVLTDTWCSSAAVLPNGTVLQTGGYNDGDRASRLYKPCAAADASCDWQEINPALALRRWYATNHILPDGRVIIVGGRRQFSYEFYPRRSEAERPRNLPFLVETNDPRVENNLYPFVFLNVDGNLFIFANNRAVLLDYAKGVVVKTYPTIPGGDPRSYPSSGSAVLLPLKSSSAAQVLVCGGAPKGAFLSGNNGNFVAALDTCGRIRINDPNPQWAMETMPGPRVMGDMVLLPNGDVLIINGAGSGTAGWELGRDPVLAPVIYRPDNPVGSRFEIQSWSATPRLYHSTAILLRDGRILVGGSNPHIFYNFTGVEFPTDLTLEAFSPPYLNSSFARTRPQIISPASQFKIGYAQQLVVGFSVGSGQVDGDSVIVTMVAPSFATHSFSMNQRMLVLGGGNVTLNASSNQIRVVTPGSPNLAPPGYYLLFVVHHNIPSEGIWVQIN
ncbi:aldehyde oxidase GLOX-like [Salvia miltiorrhiza]|uniref:aldehyde oxidase GLOX-like n=1 Tax=Salvia miltiorrhiza TaxID=226208 RepID=UPI0025ACBA37|nr:aldehyde oxidase GLOX-like [Salvia miltiorrhiza]